MQKNIVKKIASDVDNYVAFSEKRYQMICQIQNFLKEGCSCREIAKRMGIGRNTIAKYRKGDPKELSMYGMSHIYSLVFTTFYYTAKSNGKSEISFNLFPLTSVSNNSIASSEPTSFTALISSYSAK